MKAEVTVAMYTVDSHSIIACNYERCDANFDQNVLNSELSDSTLDNVVTKGMDIKIC